MNFTNFRDLIDYIDENSEGDEEYFFAYVIILIFCTGYKNSVDYSFDEFVDGMDLPNYIDKEYVKSVYNTMPEHIRHYIENIGNIIPFHKK